MAAVDQYPVGTALSSKPAAACEARDSEWQWHQLGHMQVCTSIQTDNHANTPPLSFLLSGGVSCFILLLKLALHILYNYNKSLKHHPKQKLLVVQSDTFKPILSFIYFLKH